jgi:hypothetical protein
MIILSPKNLLQLSLGKTTKKMSVSSPQSGITHNGCTRASIGTVTNEMFKSVPNFTLTKQILSTVLQISGLTEHCITASYLPSIEINKLFLRGSDFLSVLLGFSFLENEQLPNHTIGVLGSMGVHRTVCVLLMLM